jgi:hypothetical protein
MTFASSLTQLHIAMLNIANLANGRQTILPDKPLLTRWQANGSILRTFFRKKLGRGTG